MRPSPWLRLTALLGAAGTLLAVVSGSAGLGTAHRVLAALALPPLAAVVAAAWVSYRRLLYPSVAALVLFGLAAAVTAPGIHLTLSALSFAATLVVVAQAWRGTQPTLQQTVTKSFGGTVRDYLTLTKPRIMSLLLLTGLCGMIVGAGGLPPVWLVATTMLGLALACGGASALNHVLDADIDRLMGKRTRSRPVAAGRISASYALEFGLALSALSFVLLAGIVNVLTALLALSGILFYVLVYTKLLKRSTPQNIVIGGAAGAIPPLVGWAAATGSLTFPALVLFAVVFLWTPPHFWALALLIKRDYANAGVPMLPVVRGERETVKEILLYTAALVAFTLAPALWGQFGLVYLVAAAALGAGFLGLAWNLRRERTPARAALLFHYSLAYLAALFVAMALDTVLA
jgi:protoheme IX farnesyltransferase